MGLLQLLSAPDALGQRVDVKPPDPAKIDYFYDFDSIFATPKQASLFPSPYGKIKQPRQTPSGFGGALGLGNIFAQPVNTQQQQPIRRAKGGLIDTTTDDLLRIVGGK